MTTPTVPTKPRKLKYDTLVRIAGGDVRVILGAGTHLQKTDEIYVRQDSVPTSLHVYEVVGGYHHGMKIYRIDNDLEKYLVDD